MMNSEKKINTIYLPPPIPPPLPQEEDEDDEEKPDILK